MASTVPTVEFELHDEDRKVLARCATYLERDFVRVRPLGRYGFTGSHLYIAWFQPRGGAPFVIKVNEREKIMEEVAALKTVRTAFRDAQFDAPPTRANRSALIYPLVGDDQSSVTEFEEIAFDQLGSSQATERAAHCLREVYDRGCVNAHVAARTNSVLGTEYDRYLRGDGSTEAVAQILGRPRRAGTFLFLDAEIPDPRWVLRRIARRELPLHRSVVHGDLHPKNVMLDGDGHAHLIDFAWGHSHGHVLKDFVLMECSLRFLLFPPQMHLPTQLQMDEALLSWDGFKRLKSCPARRAHGVDYRRLGCLLEVIRTSARKSCGGTAFDFTEYLYAQFMVLYGLMKYQDYHHHAAIRTLGLVGARLL